MGKERAEEERHLEPPLMGRDREERTMAAPFAGAQTIGKMSAPITPPTKGERELMQWTRGSL